MSDLLRYLKTNPLVLAPMAGITDRAFRTFMRELGCGIVVTELVSAHGIEYKSQRTLKLMEFDEVQRPVGIQLFGETPEVLAVGAKVAENMGADFIDLNFGCPVPKVVKKGAGSAILKDLPMVEKVFRAVKGAVGIPVTVKIRTGWDENSRNAEKVTEIAYNEGLTWVAIHGRTRSAGYSGLSDWDYISQVKAKSKISIIGNGDIHNAATAVRRLKESGCDGVMIGRGCLKNPWIFQEAQELLKNDANKPLTNQLTKIVPAEPEEFSGLRNVSLEDRDMLVNRDFVYLFRNLRAKFEQTTDTKITTLQLKKFASWYSSGYPGSSQFRKTIFQTQSLEETMDRTLAYFSDLKVVAQMDTSQEAFLMGGHG